MACSGAGESIGSRTPRIPGASAAPSSSAERPGADAARLVIVVIIDQLPSWALDRHLPHLEEQGALRSGIARGTFHRRVVLPYAATYTAAGHAAIHTGQPPARSGVGTNELWSSERHAEIPIVADARHPVFENANASASPAALKAPTVADVLKAETRGAARVVSLSLKDRAAVLSGGQKADMAVWYDPKIGNFTTSSYYAPRMPDFLAEWRIRHPPKERLRPWQPLDAQLLSRAVGRDDAPGEGDWLGLGRTFPHLVAAASEPLRALRVSPALNDAMLDLAERAVETFELGADATPDLLALSISTLDYVGHIFGPESWEYLDALLRVDAALTAFFRRLEQQTAISVLITSDHGAAPLPERSRAMGRVSGRIYPAELAREANRAVDRALGAGHWVEAFSEPFIYLSKASVARRAEVVPVIVAAIAALDSVHAVYDARAARAFAGEDAVRRAVALSIPDDAVDRLYVVPERWFIVDPDVARGFGTSHGSPWEYDREIPVIAWGAGVPHVETRTLLDQLRIAPTIAVLLGVRPPNGRADLLSR